MEKPSVKKKWYTCPHCGAKMILYDNTANCSGVFTTCTRGCRSEVEILIKDGEQLEPSTGLPAFKSNR